MDIIYNVPKNVTSGVYLIQTEDNNFYIGSSKDIKKRVQNHVNSLKLGKHPNYRLQKLYNKKRASWQVLLVEQTLPSHILVAEQAHITKHFKDTRCLNILPLAHGGGGMLSRKHSLSAKLKIGNSNRNKTRTSETILKLSQSHKGKKLSKKTRLKMSQSHLKLKPRTAEHCLNISIVKKGCSNAKTWFTRKANIYFKNVCPLYKS